MPHIPYSKPVIPEAANDLCKDVFKSGYVSQGKYLELLEQRLAEYTGAKYVVAVSSASAGLHLAVMASELGDGDKVLTCPNTFVSTITGAMHCGATPVLADMDAQSSCIDINEVEKSVAQNDVKAVLPISFAGQNHDVKALYNLSYKYGFKIIVDHSHSIGAEYQVDGKSFKSGCAQHADMEVFSFQAVKHITSGEGGAVTTNDEAIYQKLKNLRSHGMHKTNDMTGWEYDVVDLGFNYRISETQCAMLLPQLDELDKRIAEKQRQAEYYRALLKDVPDVILPAEVSNTSHTYHLFVIQSPHRNELFKKLRERGYGVQVHYIPLHYHSLIKNHTSYQKGDFPVSENYYQKALSLPLYPGLEKNHQENVAQIIAEAHQ